MQQLPRELVDAILHFCVTTGSKNNVLELRRVCRHFDRILKPLVCRTLGLDFSRLSKTSGSNAQIDALQTVGYNANSIFIDLMVVRDDMEVEFLNTVFRHVASMTDFCRVLQSRYCMNEISFTETEYYQTLEQMLFYCRGIDRLRLNLPFQLVGRHCNAATMILANAFKAFAHRPEEDSADLKVLVLENLPDIAICHLWMNPMDIMNMMKVLHSVKHLVMTLRKHEQDPERTSLFGSCLWSTVENADRLESLYISGLDIDDYPVDGVRRVKNWQTPVNLWRARALPLPQVVMSNLTCLELNRVEIEPDLLLRCAENFGSSLAELFLNDVYLKYEQSPLGIAHSPSVLWVGVPNVRPPLTSRWVAMELRCALPRLRVCRATSLVYDLYLQEDFPSPPMPDIDDPCGMKRSLSQRFVEVVMGVEQPSMDNGHPAIFLPLDYTYDYLTKNLTPRLMVTKPDGGISYAEIPKTDYDTKAYQEYVDNPTSKWYKTVDEVYPNCNPETLSKLHYIAETACQGMNEIHQRRNEWTAGSSMLNEYAENLAEAEAEANAAAVTATANTGNTVEANTTGSDT